jgi:hypothetical protein
VDWPTYTRLLRAFAERPGVRLTYDRGELEIMAPPWKHGADGRFLGDLVFVLSEELGLPLKRAAPRRCDGAGGGASSRTNASGSPTPPAWRAAGASTCAPTRRPTWPSRSM